MWPRNQVPPAHAEIDWSHPLTRGLVLAVHGGAVYGDTYGSSSGSLVKVNGRLKSTSARGVRGPGCYEGNGTDAMATLGIFRNETEATWVVEAQIDGAGGGSYSRILEFSMGSVAVVNAGSAFDIYRVTSGTSAVMQATFMYSATQYNTFGFYFPNSVTNTDIKAWLNGSPKSLNSIQAGTGSPAGNSTWVSHLLGDNGGTRAMDGRIRFAYKWNRALTDAEHRWISDEPWCIWTWPEKNCDLRYVDDAVKYSNTRRMLFATGTGTATLGSNGYGMNLSSCAVTTQFDDVGLDDHTTYEEVSSLSDYVNMTMIVDLGAIRAIDELTASIYWKYTPTWRLDKSSDGTTWTQVSASASPTPANKGGTASWTDLSITFTAASARYFRISWADQGSSLGGGE